MALEWDKFIYSQQRHEEINLRETATADPEPFLLLPSEPNRIGVVLVHGFLASPAEVRGFGEKLYAEGYNVIGVRLRGHGTSPWDLRGRRWEDWLDSVRKGFDIMREFNDEVCVVGFSTGGGLCLALAAERPGGLCGVTAISTPIRYRNKNMWFVPLMHGTNKIVRWLSSYEGIMPFRVNQS
jgi:esterase/lipase